MLPLPNKITFFEQELTKKTKEELEKMIKEIEEYKPINWLSAIAKTSQLEILKKLHIEK